MNDALTEAQALTTGLADEIRKMAVLRADEVGRMDARGAAIWDVASWLAENPSAAALVDAHLAELRAQLADTEAKLRAARSALAAWREVREANRG